MAAKWSEERRLMIGMLSMLADYPELRQTVRKHTAIEMHELEIAEEAFAQAVDWLTECLMSGEIEEA